MLTEKFVDFVSDDRGVLRKVVVDTETGKQSYMPTDSKKRFVDIVDGKRMMYNPITGKTEYEPVQ